MTALTLAELNAAPNTTKAMRPLTPTQAASVAALLSSARPVPTTNGARA